MGIIRELALVCAVVALSATAAHAGKPPYTQCGGTTGCTGTQCRDGRWPLNQGGACPPKYRCFRISEYYYQCDLNQPPTDTPKPAPKPTAIPLKPSAFRQCGGSGDGCIGKKCQDAQWPLAEGGRCDAGTKCFRLSQYYWACDRTQPTLKPQTSTPRPATPAPKPTLDLGQVATPAPAKTGARPTADANGKPLPTPKPLATAKPLPTPKPSKVRVIPDKYFRQCGGSGGVCSGGAHCRDARWPYSLGGKCAGGLQCYRWTQHYWGCDRIGEKPACTA